MAELHDSWLQTKFSAPPLPFSCVLAKTKVFLPCLKSLLSWVSFLMEVICMLVFMEHSVSPKSSPTFSQILKAEEASAGTASQTEVTYFSVPAWFAPACYCCLCRRKRGGMKSSSSTHRTTMCRVFLLLFFSFFLFFEVNRQNSLINCECTYLYTYI